MTPGTTADGRRFGAGELALALVAAALAQALAYPQAAYSLHALVCSVMLFGALVVALVGGDAWGPRGLHRGALALLVLTVLHGAWNATRGPVPVFGWEPGSHALQFALAAGTAIAAAAKLTPERRESLPRTGALYLAGLLALQSAWGVYVSTGPEGWPRTYATLAVRYASELDPGDMVGEGLRHALAEARAAGTLGAPNVFAGVAAVGAVLALGGVLAERGRIRVACACCLAVCVSGVWLSGSRGGLLALGFGFVVLALWSGALARVKMRAVVAAAAIVLLLAPGESPAAGEPARSRWLGHTTVVQRLRYWETGTAIWREAPLFGRGAGAYRVLYPSHRIEGAGETQFAHNWIVQGLAESGVVGVGLKAGTFVLLLLLGARGALEGARDGARSRATYSAALVAGALTLLAHGLVDYTLETREGMLLLGVLLGTGAGCLPCAMAPARVLAAVVGLGAWVSLGDMHVRPIRHEIAVENVTAAVELGDSPTELRRWFGDAFDSWPRDPRGPALRARYGVRTGDPGALAQFERATELNPWSAAAQEELAYARLGMMDREGALRAIVRANELHPLDPTHWLSRAEIEFALGHVDEAKEALARAGSLARNPQEETRLQALRERIR